MNRLRKFTTPNRGSQPFPFRSWTVPLLTLVVVGCISFSGCIGAATQLMYVIKGHKVPATYPGLEGKRVAVVCVSDANAYGPDTLTYTICKGVSVKLAQAVKDIEVIPPYKIEDWVDQNGFNGTDFEQLGRDLEADMVLAIEVGSYSIHEGQTMFKGRADITATVFDIAKGGQVEFVHGPEQFTFPENGRPAIQTTDRQFEMVYLTKLTQHLARQFHPHDQTETVADDASFLDY